MFEWISDHSATLQLGSSLVMTAVWVTYLQLLVRSFGRQRRTMILINRGAGVGLNSRCFVSNLGFEPIYVLDLLVTLNLTDGSEHKTFITDRSEQRAEDFRTPAEATNQGPLNSGDFRDIGSFREVLDRANQSLDPVVDPGDIDCVDICVIATAASSRGIVAAHRAYSVSFEVEGEGELLPETVTATQMRTKWSRRKIRAPLRRRY
ncbi:hypothetical protein [Anianabacter salinae]|uniref:hypothetical protein n=1 Tax=Anianabacter salinae TaxID=2851023 RepID=UPI00225E615B|nr:hypothetical protein [Anianabacter salinae]MBV0912344.1 hypothetical protein [Anianabacter salinae]